MSNILAVYAIETDRNYLLGYVEDSDIEDIKAYFDKKKAYGLEFEEVKPIKIPKGYARKKEIAENQIRVLEKQILELKNKIVKP